jgi:(p)ppGpp synthase/HD superfamily hydrolase
MMDTELIARASRLAEAAHAGQTDKSGQPYIGHLRRVAHYVDQTNPKAIAAALLHDIVEDTDTELHDLSEAGIPEDVVAAVDLLTKRGNEPNTAYYARMMAADPISRLAREVKLADIADNSDPARLKTLDEPTRTRLIGKYAMAYTTLEADLLDGEIRRKRAS